MDSSTNVLNWFEIPTTDIERAKRFYGAIFEIEMSDFPIGDLKMAMFPYAPGSGKLGGALIQHEMYEPRDNGVLIYLNANPDIQTVIERIEPAGGKIVIPRTQISPDIGYMAVFTDTEGNRIALHAQN